MYTDYDDEYLMHYGVPGMKWGVRKAKAISGFVKKMADPNQRQAWSMAKKGAAKYKAFNAKKAVNAKRAAAAQTASIYSKIAKDSKAYKGMAGAAKRSGRFTKAVGKTGQFYGRHGVNRVKGFGAKAYDSEMGRSARFHMGNARESLKGAKSKWDNRIRTAKNVQTPGMAKYNKGSAFFNKHKKAIAVGAGVAAAGAAAYGGYKAYKSYKAKREKKQQQGRRR